MASHFGKILGGGLGWAFGGPLGALIGVAIGGILDVGNSAGQTRRSIIGNNPHQTQ
ncbi:MAG: molecular chaperone DjiA, partial [Crocinitomicaceae bacterium]|nr:molecular chaperone DjiA [Crocinitomicaceae bacterium]